ncbi:MAG: energy-coupling factor transporter ATPase, partial [Lachnospiraceae bacterium]|nr:energy-coupling factor transporter ATPase [Lachnospiraceae bacterium]
LILDEPTAGLDPQGRKDVLEMCRSLNRNGITILLVSHSMEDVAAYADRVLVMDQGKLLMDGTTKEVFSRVEELESVGLSAPETVYLMRDLRAAGIDVPTDVLSFQEAKETLLRVFGDPK